jgi:protein TonB
MKYVNLKSLLILTCCLVLFSCSKQESDTKESSEHPGIIEEVPPEEEASNTVLPAMDETATESASKSVQEELKEKPTPIEERTKPTPKLYHAVPPAEELPSLPPHGGHHPPTPHNADPGAIPSEPSGEQGEASTSLPVPKNENSSQLVEEIPLFGGCNGNNKRANEQCSQMAVIKYINSHVQYPALAQENGIEGNVIVSFVIDKTGKVTNAEVARSAHPVLSTEALRVIKSMPNWTPGSQDGKPIAVRMNLPVRFKLRS